LNNSRLSIKQYEDGILSSNRVILSQAITLIESNKPEDQQLASELIDRVINKTGNSIRIGITGVPGVGKSTFIEVFGKHLTDSQKKVAVLTVDPSSQLTKGSILGDKTRMEGLSKNPLAFIRPSATGNTLGGVTNKTREAILLCEAAGYEVIIIETVGVGQSEVAVKNMTDFFLLLVLAGAGDELQGIKKGIMEMADALVITKADGDNITHVKAAQAEYQHALHLSEALNANWTPKVLTCSSQTNTGIDEIWALILNFKNHTETSGSFKNNREQQSVLWMKEIFEQQLQNDISRNAEFQQKRKELESEVSNQKRSASAAAKKLLEAYHQLISGRRS
jgi:LAO/AO transport system kinase